MQGLAFCLRDKENKTIVFTFPEVVRDPRSVNWLVKRLAIYFSLDLGGLRRHCGKLLGLRHNISLPLDAGLVLLPIKMRQAETPGEVTTGFVNLLQIGEILPAGAGAGGADIQGPFRPAQTLPRGGHRKGIQAALCQAPAGNRGRRKAVAGLAEKGVVKITMKMQTSFALFSRLCGIIKWQTGTFKG